MTPADELDAIARGISRAFHSMSVTRDDLTEVAKALNKLFRAHQGATMEIKKFELERDAFARRLHAAIQGEIDTFIAGGGIHPERIEVRITEIHRMGDRPGRPDRVVTDVEVSFGL